MSRGRWRHAVASQLVLGRSRVRRRAEAGGGLGENRGSLENPRPACEIKRKRGHQIDDQKTGRPTARKGNLCVQACGGHFLGLDLMTSILAGSGHLRVGYFSLLGARFWDSWAGRSRWSIVDLILRSWPFWRLSFNHIRKGLVVVFSVALIFRSVWQSRIQRGHMAWMSQLTKATLRVEGAARPKPKTLERPLSRKPCPGSRGLWKSGASRDGVADAPAHGEYCRGSVRVVWSGGQRGGNRVAARASQGASDALC